MSNYRIRCLDGGGSTYFTIKIFKHIYLAVIMGLELGTSKLQVHAHNQETKPVPTDLDFHYYIIFEKKKVGTKKLDKSKLLWYLRAGRTLSALHWQHCFASSVRVRLHPGFNGVDLFYYLNKVENKRLWGTAQ